jgi:hypothetical protein
LRLDGDGEPLWSRCLGGSATDIGHAAAETPDGGFIAAGRTGSRDGDVSESKGADDAWVVKVDRDGRKLWDTSVGGRGDDSAHAVAILPDGGIAAAGRGVSTELTGRKDDEYGGLVFRLTPDGILVWRRALADARAVRFNGLAVTSEGLVAAGRAGFPAGRVPKGDLKGCQPLGGFDLLLSGLDLDGRPLWALCAGGPADDRGMSVAAFPDGSIAAGGYTDSQDAIPSPEGNSSLVEDGSGSAGESLGDTDGTEAGGAFREAIIIRLKARH